MIESYVTQSELRRRAGGISNRTFRKRIALAGIAPDAVLLEKSAKVSASALFNVSRLPELRLALMVKRPLATIATK